MTTARAAHPVDQANDQPAARRRERARCKAIIARAQALGASPDVAAALAFDTQLSRREAIALLSDPRFAAPVEGAHPSLDARMAAAMRDVPMIGPEVVASVPAHLTAAAAAIIAAGERARRGGSAC